MNTYTLDVVPKPDAINRNGLFYSKNDLDEAISKYLENYETSKRLVTLGYPSNEHDMFCVNLNKVCGTVKSIKYNDDVHAYVADIELIDNPMMKYINSHLNPIKYEMALNKTGIVNESNTVTDITITSVSLVPKHDSTFQN